MSPPFARINIPFLRTYSRFVSAPNELYRVPLTDANNSGWLIPNDGTTLIRDKYDWAYTPRFVHVNSPMTR